MGDFGRLGVAAYRGHGDHADLSDRHRARGESLWNTISRPSLAIDAWAWCCKHMLLHSFEIRRLRLSLWGCLHGNLSRSFAVRVAAGWSRAGVWNDGCRWGRAGCLRAVASQAASATAF